MTVKEIPNQTTLNDKVEIIDQKKYIRYWSGQGKDIPLRYYDYEVKHIYSRTYEYGNTENVISIIV